MATETPSLAMQRYYDRKKELFHWGVKGMRWGVRKGVGEPVAATTTHKPGHRVKAEGGTKQAASEDAIAAAKAHQTAKKSTTDALSNKELQQLVNRMQLEQQFNQLNSSGPRASAGRKFANDFLQNGGRDITINAIGESAKAATNLVPGVPAARIGIGIGKAIAEAYVRKAAGKKK